MKVKLELGEPQGVVDQKIYGQFIEHILTCINGGIYDPANPLSDEKGIRRDVLEKLKELSPSVLRFPGGTIMCQYHWEDAIGPLDRRIRRKNLIWGGELDPAFGTAEFVMLCREIGAEPMLCVNMASGTAEEAANWVEYCNGTGSTYYANLRRKHGYEKPFDVKYWCIGNESYAEPDIGVHHDVNLYVRDAMEFIKWMKLTDRSIQTVVVGCDDEHWNKTVLDHLQEVTDYFSYHHYASDGGRGIYAPFLCLQNLQKQLGKIAELIDTYPEKVENFNPWYRFPPRQQKIKIALDEWNIWDFKPDETYGLLMRYNWRDAVWTANMLHLLIMNASVGMANLAQSVNVLAPILADETGSWYQTTAYVWKLYREYMNGERIDLRLVSPVLQTENGESLEALSIAAVRVQEGKINIAIVNRDFANEHTLLLPDGNYEAVMLECSVPEAVCTRDECCVAESRFRLKEQLLRLPKGSIAILTQC